MEVKFAGGCVADAVAPPCEAEEAQERLRVRRRVAGSAGRTRNKNRTASVSMRFIKSSKSVNASFLNSTSGSFCP